MINITKRNLLIFFRDKAAVFFSLLSVLIIITLYTVFLGDVWVSNFSDIENARFLMDSWIMAGMLAVASLTTTMGAFGIMVDDRTKKIIKDFQSSPIKKSSIAGGYIASSFIIGVIMSIITLVLMEIYIVANGGSLLGVVLAIKVFGLILLSALTSTAMVFFLVSFFKSQNAFSTASAIIGTLIGFITGIYLPIGMFPDMVQYIVKVFPISHAALLFRQVIMEPTLQTSFADVPVEYLEGFKETMGLTFRFGDYTVSTLVSILILVLTIVIFYGLAILSISRKSR